MTPPTPCLIVDSKVLSANIDRMARITSAAGTALRPHVKTHKIPEFARRQLAAGATGITVAKVGEAEVMARSGIDDIFIAYPLIDPRAIERALALTDGRRLVFAVDSIEAARRLSEAAAEHSLRVEARLEIESGLRRTGCAAGAAPELAAAIAALGGIDLTGIFTFRGSLMEGRPTLDRRAAGLEEGRLMVALAEELRGRGLPIREVSVGSTPTAEFAATVPGVTEVRPGTYIFNDRMQLAYGACSPADCALTLLVTVVSVARDHVVVDGGSKALSTDALPGREPLRLRGYGAVVDHPSLVIDRMSEEHGVIETPDGQSLRVGDRLRILPNHVCTTVNLHDTLWLQEGEDFDERAIEARGKMQ